MSEQSTHLDQSITAWTTSLFRNNTDSSDQFVSDIKVKVDRKVLEAMLTEEDSGLSTSAQNFFVNISDESGAVISYPQRLKLETIGRKEPEIRILGTPAQIHLARSKIMEVMDPHRNRVTLKIDVAHTDHSHIIGKGGKRIQSVMDLTECHIHFPDSNRTNVEEKSNQVTIAGTSLRQAEQAREMIRQYLPLTISFQFEVNGGNIALLESSHPNVQYFQSRYNVIITFRLSELSSLNTLATVTLRGTRIQFENLKEATRALYDYLNWSPIGFNNTVISLKIDIAPQHHSFVMGRANCNIKAINDHTGAVVTFPNVVVGAQSLVPALQMSTVTIRGRGIESAYMAWIELLGYLPMILIFDLKPDQAIDGKLITSLMANQLLSIVIRPKLRSSVNTIVIKTQERHSDLLFDARNRILNMTAEKEMPSTHKTVVPLSTCGLSIRPPGLPSGFTRFPFSTDMEPEIMRAFREFMESE